MKLPIRRQPADQTDRVDTTVSEADTLADRFSREFDRWPDFFQPFSDVFQRVMPLADVEESDEAFIVDIELPGVQRDAISVEVTGDRLFVTGERRERHRVGLLRQQTRSTGTFHFEVTLPSEVDVAGVDATLDDGVLHVVVPKSAAARPRKISIRSGSQREVSA